MNQSMIYDLPAIPHSEISQTTRLSDTQKNEVFSMRTAVVELKNKQTEIFHEMTWAWPN